MASREISSDSDTEMSSEESVREIEVEDPGYHTEDLERDFGLDEGEPEPIPANPITSIVPRSAAEARTEAPASTSSPSLSGRFKTLAKRNIQEGSSSRRMVPDPPYKIISSLLTEEVICNFYGMYDIPSSFTLTPAIKDETVSSCRGRRVALYERFFKFGLRLPFSPFFTSFLKKFRVMPCQFAPNAIQLLRGTEVIFRLLSLELSTDIFQHLWSFNRSKDGWYYIKCRVPQFIIGIESSNHHWKPEYFFASSDQPWGFNLGWGELNTTKANRKPKLSEQDKETLEIFRCSVTEEDIVFKAKVLTSDTYLAASGLCPLGPGKSSGFLSWCVLY